MRLGLVTSWLTGGGAERQVALWARICVEQGHDVTVLSFVRTPEDFDVPGARVVHLEKTRRSHLLRLPGQIRRHARNLDALIAFEPYPALCCALARPAVPWLHVTGKHPAYLRHSSRIPLTAYRVAFSAPSLLATPTRGMIECHESMGLGRGKRWLQIPNAVDDGAFAAPGDGRAAAGEGALFVGRLVPLKNPHAAIDAAVAARMPLTLLGEGELEDSVRASAVAAANGTPVTVLPFQAEPWTVYAAHRVLVVTSEYESFGNVIIESLAAGTPVVSVDCDFGPREILADARFSRLVGRSVDEIAAALREVADRPYSEEEWRECRSIAARYRTDAIRPLVGDALDRLAAHGSSRA